MNKYESFRQPFNENLSIDNQNERWDGEAGVRVDLFDTKFTMIESGIFYRF
ncbi:MAG: hypothetical protein ACI9FN_001940 [Saprospiraceae bacterium]|jgi:hypothetical protein